VEKIKITEQKVEAILRAIQEVSVSTVGDLCLDYYLFADMKRSILSRETPHYPLPVVREAASPGGGGNVIQNIKALGVKSVLPVSVIGKDWRSYLLKELFHQQGITTDTIAESEALVTNCYIKPMRMGISDVMYEDPRLDFENRAPLSRKDEDHLIDVLRETANKTDILVVSDQMHFGVITPRVRKVISGIGKHMPVIADSRENAGFYSDVIIKPNEVEAAALVGRVVQDRELNIDELIEIGLSLQKKNQCPVIITLGERGALWLEDGKASLAPTAKADPPVDFVGAGDTFISAFSAAFAAGFSGAEAACFANLASGVTVKKIGTTGTASPEEILMKYREIAEK